MKVGAKLTETSGPIYSVCTPVMLCTRNSVLGAEAAADWSRAIAKCAASSGL